MNVYPTKFMTYYEIHRMRREGHSTSQISKHLVINRRTVARYLSMSEEDYEAFLVSQSERSGILDQYEKFIVDKLKQFGDTSCAQMHDWLKECYCDFPKVNPKTVFNYVSRIREKYNIPRISEPRQCMIVEELPFGKQTQVDFGEYNMRDTPGKRVKVSFMAMILCRSRYKYVAFVKGHFDTALAIQAHEQGFDYFQGITEVIVYDQDRVFLASPWGRDKLFDRFFRVNRRGSATFPGMGLGLYISQEILKRHGGSITLEENEGEGTTFLVHLPYRLNA